MIKELLPCKLINLDGHFFVSHSVQPDLGEKEITKENTSKEELLKIYFSVKGKTVKKKIKELIKEHEK